MTSVKKIKDKEDWISKVQRIQYAHQLDDLSVPDMRNMISKLTVECFYKEKFDGKKPRGMWNRESPAGWPRTVPFVDPHNKPAHGQKPTKTELRPMLRFLVWTYNMQNSNQPVHFTAEEHPIQASEYVDEIDDGTAPPQPYINPGCNVKAGSPIEVSYQSDSNASPLIQSIHRVSMKLKLSNMDPDACRLQSLLSTVDKETTQALKKPMLKLLHQIEFYLDLDNAEKDEQDESDYRTSIDLLEQNVYRKNIGNATPTFEGTDEVKVTTECNQHMQTVDQDWNILFEYLQENKMKYEGIDEMLSKPTYDSSLLQAPSYIQEESDNLKYEGIDEMPTCNLQLLPTPRYTECFEESTPETYNDIKPELPGITSLLANHQYIAAQSPFQESSCFEDHAYYSSSIPKAIDKYNQEVAMDIQ